MISEHGFSTHFASFWRSALPNLETVVRALNLSADRFARPLKPNTHAYRRDVISETGYRLYGLSLQHAKAHPSDLVPEAYASALDYLDRRPSEISADEAAEAIEMCRRLRFFAADLGSSVEFMPAFLGHGMMTTCHGDIAVDDRLIEVKYVDRSFRSTDARQLLCYCGLRYFSEGATFDEVILANPLRGTSIGIGVPELIDSASGRVPADFFSELSYILASGEISR